MPQTLTQRAYAGYRLSLKSLHGAHAAQRRQHARELTAARYKLPVSAIKAIVQEMDQSRGITHEHDPAYLRSLEIRDVQLTYEAIPVPCECGNWQMVRARPNPIRQAADGRAQITLQCFLCYLTDERTSDPGMSSEETSDFLARVAQARIEDIAKGRPSSVAT